MKGFCCFVFVVGERKEIKFFLMKRIDSFLCCVKKRSHREPLVFLIALFQFSKFFFFVSLISQDPPGHQPFFSHTGDSLLCGNKK